MDYSLKIKQVALKVELFFRGLGSKIVTAYNKHVKQDETRVISINEDKNTIHDIETAEDNEVIEGLDVNKITEEVIGSPKNHDD
jgi:hypothetical protein